MLRIPLFRKNNETAEDPVCHMKVDMNKPGGGTFEYKDTTYYFCAPGCNRAFQKDPEAYLTGEKKLDM